MLSIEATGAESHAGRLYCASPEYTNSARLDIVWSYLIHRFENKSYSESHWYNSSRKIVEINYLWKLKLNRTD